MSGKYEKDKSLFWKIYKISLTVAAILVVLGLIYLTMILKDYEAAQPKYVAEETFKEYFENFDAETYVKACNMDNGYESVDDVVASLEEITDGKDIKYYRVSTGMDKSFKYIVKADDVKFASFKLVEDTESTGKFTMYKASDFELYVNGSNGVTVIVPDGYKVFLNDNEVPADKISESGIKSDDEQYLPKDIKGILYSKYVVSGLLSEPDIKVTDSNGKVSYVEKQDDGTYKASPVYSEELKKQYHDWIMQGMKRYSEYMQHSSNNPVTFGEISVYYDPSSDLYEDIKTEENMFVYDYDSVEYLNEETCEYIQYDENTFSCRVKYVQVLHKYGENDYKDTIDTTLFLRNVDGEFLIYNKKLN